MIRPIACIDIDASPADVIGLTADPANAPRWMKALEVSELITPGPICVGKRFPLGDALTFRIDPALIG